MHLPFPAPFCLCLCQEAVPESCLLFLAIAMFPSLASLSLGDFVSRWAQWGLLVSWGLSWGVLSSP